MGEGESGRGGGLHYRGKEMRIQKHTELEVDKKAFAVAMKILISCLASRRLRPRRCFLTLGWRPTRKLAGAGRGRRSTRF